MSITTRQSQFEQAGGNGLRAEGPDILTSAAENRARRGRTTWTVSMERALLNVLVAGGRKPKRKGYKFPKEVLNSAVDEVNKVYCPARSGSEGGPVKLHHMTEKIKNLRKMYNSFMMLKNDSEVGWDEEKGLPTASDDVWKRMKKKYPGVQKYRYEHLEYYEELKSLYGGGTRDLGELAIPSGALKGRRQIEDVGEEEYAREMASMAAAATEFEVNKRGPTAIECVQEQYAYWDTDKMITAMSILLSDERKAQIFRAMEPGETRDDWINREIESYESNL